MIQAITKRVKGARERLEATSKASGETPRIPRVSILWGQNDMVLPKLSIHEMQNSLQRDLGAGPDGHAFIWIIR